MVKKRIREEKSIETEAEKENKEDKGSKTKIFSIPSLTSKKVLLPLIIIAVAIITLLVNSMITGNVSKAVVSEKAVEFFKTYQGVDITVDSIEEVSGLYKLEISLSDGRSGVIFMSRDGEYIGSMGPIKVLEVEKAVSKKEEDISKTITDQQKEIAGFVNCLKEAGFRIYGANWCGYTKSLVESFGGFDVVKPIYIECTEQQQLCQEKGIRGYPTLLINDQPYTGPRTFEGFAQATGCKAVQEIAEQSASGGSCG